MDLTIAYLAQGRLYFKAPDKAVKEISSQFVERASERARKSAERNAWKANSSGSSMLPPALLWQSQQPAEHLSNVQILGVAPGNAGEIMYALNTQSIGGLFAHDPGSGTERRLFHKPGFRARHLAKHPHRDLVALSVSENPLIAHIALTDTAGHALREITEGDARDECPSWVPGEGQKLLFQSAGVARDSQGELSTTGPYRVEQLDIDRGEMTTLLEDDKVDFLSPRAGPDGCLYYIRRPYSPHVYPFSWKKAVVDTVMFPFRLARAIVYFSNFFSMVFSGKPLLTAGGPARERHRPSTLLLWGKMIDAEKAMKASKDGASASLVPSSWQLIRQDPSGAETVLAKGIISFDLVPDGSVIHTNGSTIVQLKPNGQSETLCFGKLIEQVNCLTP